jgi:hypothetical protein
MAPEGTYADEDPNASIGEKIANSVKKTVAGVAQLASPRSVAEIRPRTEQASSDADTASNAGSQAQSTDSYNKY